MSANKANHLQEALRKTDSQRSSLNKSGFWRTTSKLDSHTLMLPSQPEADCFNLKPIASFASQLELCDQIHLLRCLRHHVIRPSWRLWCGLLLQKVLQLRSDLIQVFLTPRDCNIKGKMGEM